MLKLDKSKTTTTVFKRGNKTRDRQAAVKKTSITTFLCFFIAQIEHFMDSIKFHHVPTTDDMCEFMHKQYVSTAHTISEYIFENCLVKSPSALELSEDRLKDLLRPLAELFHHYEEYILFNNVLWYTNSRSDDFEAFKESLDEAKMRYTNNLKELVDHTKDQL